MNKVWLSKKGFKSFAAFLSVIQMISLFSLVPTVKAEDKPDLIVDSVSMSPETPVNGDSISVSAVIKNIGAPIPKDSGFTVGWDFGDKKYLWSDPINDKLDTNETIKVICNHGGDLSNGTWKAVSGKHTLNCMVDNYDANDSVNARIKESNEANNTKQMDCNIAGLQVVKIKSAWDKAGYGYLYQDGNEVKYGTPAVDDGTSQWIIANKDGYSVIQNRATGDYLNIKSKNGTVESSFVDISKEDSAKWTLKVEGAGTSIKNMANNHYIEVEENKGIARYDNDNVQGTWTSADWTFEDVDASKDFKKALPDLVVTDIKCTPELTAGGQQTLFSITVKNAGQGAMPEGEDSPAAGVNVDNKAPYYYTDAIPHPLAAGESCTLNVVGCTTAGQPKEWTALSGRHTVFATIDDWAGPDPISATRTAHHFVVESNENNNQFHKTLPLLKAGPVQKPVPANMAGATYVGNDSSILATAAEPKKVVDNFNKLKSADKLDVANIDSLVKYQLTHVVVGQANDKNADKSKFATYWDEKNLYVLAKVADAAKYKSDPAQLWNSDNVEVYIDATNSKDSGGYVDGDYQYMFGYQCDKPQESKKNAITGVASKQIDCDNGYVMLATIPWSTIGKNPKLNDYIGLDVAVDDNYKGSSRDSQTAWNASDDSEWKYPNRFGDCQLISGIDQPKQLEPPMPFDSSFKLAPKDYVVPAGRGADVPWTEYEAEKAKTNGMLVGPSAVLNDEAAEASGRKFVELSKNGDYVTFKALKDANSIVVRYSIPDSANGSGIEAPISVYVNNVKKKELMLSSKYCWNYGAFPWSNDPSQGGAHHFFDEAHAIIGNFKAGDNITLKVDNSKTDYYDIDFVDLENVGEALTKSDNFISITDFGADPTGKKDSTNAIYKTIAAAKKQGKGVWIPAGTFKREDGPKVGTSYKNASGNGYVSGFNTTGATEKVKLQDIAKDGTYNAVIRYANGTGKAQTISLYTNGKFTSKLSLSPTKDWNTWAEKSVSIKLNKGGDAIQFIQEDLDKGDIALDCVTVGGTKYEMEVGIGKDRAYLTCPIYVNNLEIRGAGMWYSTLTGYYDQIMCTGNNCTFSDFAVFGGTDSRTDELGDNAFAGNAGKGSSLDSIWVEHTKCGFWVGETVFGDTNSENSNGGRTDGLVIKNCRFRDTMADGVNLCDGTTNSIIVNCSARNTGDDSFAIWPAYYNQSKWGSDNNRIENCTAQLPWLAQGIALYGGDSNQAVNNLIVDCPTSAGILISSTFTPSAKFSGTTLVQHNSIVRCGEYSQLYGGLRVMVDQLDISGLNVDDIDIYNSVDCGIRFMEGSHGKTLTNSVFSNINIQYCTTNGILCSGDTIGEANMQNIKIENSGQKDIKNDSKKFTLNK